MSYLSPGEKREAKAKFGYLKLLLFSGALLFAVAGEPNKEVPAAETLKPVDERKRRMLKVAAGAGIGLAGLLAAIKSPFLGAATKTITEPKPPSGVYMELTAGGQAAQVPSVASVPSAASAGAITYSSTKGRFFEFNGILGEWQRAGLESLPDAVVSPKGINNVLSTEYNDGWGQWGPDYPGTQSYGLKELAASLTSGGVMRLLQGTYAVTGNTTIAVASPSVTIQGSGRGTETLNGTIITTNSTTADLISVTADFFGLRDLTLQSLGTQSSGAAVRTAVGTSAFRPIMQRVRILASSYSVGGFWQGVILDGQYGVCEDFWINCCVSDSVVVGNAGLSNNTRIERLEVNNSGYATTALIPGPTGINLIQTGCTYVVGACLVYCNPGLNISPASPNTVTESFFMSVQCDSNNGPAIRSTGTGTWRQCHFSSFWANSNCGTISGYPAVAGEAAINITPGSGGLVENIDFSGGECGGNWYGGVALVGTGGDMGFSLFKVFDNNQSDGTTSGYSGFGSLLYAAYYVNTTVTGSTVTVLGGCADNPGVYTSTGHQSGLILSKIGSMAVFRDVMCSRNNGSEPYGVAYSAGFFIFNCPGIVPGAASPNTAGTSPYTFQLPYNAIFVITTVGGMTVLAVEGRSGSQAIFNGSFSVGQNFFVPAQTQVIVTWSTTAPVFEIIPTV
jgi:hypothetical protein